MRILFPLYHHQVEHLGVMYLSSILKKKGHHVEVVHAVPETIAEALRRGGATVLAYSSETMLARYYLHVNRRTLAMLDSGERPRLVIMGGAHAIFFPQVIHEEGIEAVCIGEGEETISELTDALEQSSDIGGIPGLWVKRGREVHRGPLRPLVQDLDRLPHPDRNLFSLDGSTPFYRASVITTRGCPFNCPYCFNHAYTEMFGEAGRRVRQRSFLDVLSEVRALKKMGHIRLIMFEDDIFVLDTRWLEEFLARYREEMALPYHCQVRSEMVTRELVELLESSGCRTVTMGIETGNDDLRINLLRRNQTKEQILEACRLLRRAGIRVNTTNMIGLPGSDIDADLETLELNVRCRPTYARVHMLQPYPGTEIYDYARERGLLDESYEGYLDGEFPAVTRTPPLLYRTPLQRRMVENLHKLFPLAVRFALLRVLIRPLIKLPLYGPYTPGFRQSRITCCPD